MTHLWREAWGESISLVKKMTRLTLGEIDSGPAGGTKASDNGVAADVRG